MQPGGPTPDHRRGRALLALGATALGLTLGGCGSTEAADAPLGDCPVAPVGVVATQPGHASTPMIRQAAAG